MGVGAGCLIHTEAGAVQRDMAHSPPTGFIFFRVGHCCVLVGGVGGSQNELGYSIKEV